jgi:class 3 adenylate cyclase
VELGVLGPLQVRQYGLPVSIPGAKPRAILTMLGLHGGSIVSSETLLELLWGNDPPRTATKALQTHISSLRRALGDGFVLTEGTGWILSTTDIDAFRYKSAAKLGRDAMGMLEASQAVAHFDEALTLWRDPPELPDTSRGLSEKTRWIESHASLVEDRADALLATDRAAEIIGELEAAIADAPLRERRWGQLMLALYRAGRQGEALGAYQRARSLLAEELGVDPGPDLRKLEAAIVAQDDSLEITVSQQVPTITRAVTFLLTDIEGSTAAWEADAGAMAVALARHDELVEQVVTSRGGRLVKTRGEGDATFSVFDRPSGAAAAAIELQEAIRHEPWALHDPMRIRVALHTGEVEFRDGDYFGRAVNRAARLRSLATGGQILCSGATAELVIDTLPDAVVLADLGTRQLRNLARPEHVFELRLGSTEHPDDFAPDTPIQRPELPAVLSGPGPFVGRDRELERLLSTWQTSLTSGTRAVLIAGEPGVGKTRLAGEWTRQAYELGAVVLYGRCDEDLGAPYQPFAEALRMLVHCLGGDRLRSLRGVEALLPLIPGLTDVLPDLVKPTHADAETERYALFDAAVALLGVASASAPVVLVLDDLHWAAKSTLLLLRHLLRFGEHVRVQIVGTYRSTDLDRKHPLAAMLADLHRDGSADRLSLGGLDDDDVSAYVAEAGYDDEELARALASVTGGNPFFLIEALRQVDESGGRWDPSTLPQGIREAVSRRLSRLSEATSTALAAAAVVGSRFALDLVEQVTGDDLVDAFDEARRAGIVIEEPGGLYRFNHALVRQSLLAELASVRRMRLHQRIAVTLEAETGADDELLAELAHHYFECAWAGNAAKAVEYCRRAADQAMTRVAYEGAADLYDRALHALEDLDDDLPDRDEQQAELMIARLEALLAAGDVATAARAVPKLQAATRGSARLAAWATCFDGQLSILTDPERLDEIEAAVRSAAEMLARLDDAAGEAKAHTVRAGCLARLGRIADCELALDQALTAARRARDDRRVNAVLANAPLAALWGPSPVPRAGGRCLDVVRLLRITTGSPVVETTSTRCQGVLDAFRGRAAAGRRLIDSARRTLTELGMRHALLEVEQFAGIVELVADDPAAAEPHLRRACDGFRRMHLDADTAETAALLARACLALDRDAEAVELCAESERLAGHALKASMGWRTVRAQLLARSGDHDEARRVAEEAVSIAGGTDALVDHGDACLALATVLFTAGDDAGGRAAAERALGLYETKGAAALAKKAGTVLGLAAAAFAPTTSEALQVELENECTQVAKRAMAAINREALDEAEQLWAPDVLLESRRKIVGFTADDLRPEEWYARRALEVGGVRVSGSVIAIRGERLALSRTAIATTDVSPGAPSDEFLRVFGLDEEGRIALEVWFDLDDMDAAVAELDAVHAGLEGLHRRMPLENAASRAEQHLGALFAERRWGEIDAKLDDGVQIEERRRGIRLKSSERAALSAEMRVIADLGVKTMTSVPVAIRGRRLVLSRVRFSGRDQRPDAFQTELLRFAEMDDDEHFTAVVTFDVDDIDGAIAELEARYLAGEAAPHSDTWSLIAKAYAALNRRETHPTTPDWVNIDHRRRAPFASGDGTDYFQASWDVAPDLRLYIEAVHRLSDLGAVLTRVAKGTSRNGFEAEWRAIDIITVEGDLISRVEHFDEEDLDAAIARFDELSQPAHRLENAASQTYERLRAYFAARDWYAVAELIADDIANEDRRRVVNQGMRVGRDATVASMRATADLGVTNLTATVLATRGARLALTRDRFSVDDPGTEAFEAGVLEAEVLGIVEIDAHDRIAARIAFDSDDIDAAFAELDARYLAGEAAAYANTWSAITRNYAAFNRHELVSTTPDWVNLDHRQGRAFVPGDLTPYIAATWAVAPDINTRIEAVHRLSEVGAIITQVSKGTADEGFEAEWRELNLLTTDGELVARSELFEESDLDAALARFDELSAPERRLENAATRLAMRFCRTFAARDWQAMADVLAEDTSTEDRRRVVGAGVRRGRDAEIENQRTWANVGIKEFTFDVIAIRGQRLALLRAQWSDSGQPPEAFNTEAFLVAEINADDTIEARVAFDLDQLDAAFDELETRYLTGEAAEYARTWAVITNAHAALTRHELPPTTPDWVNIDHRRVTAIATGEISANVRSIWDVTPDFRFAVESVHRLSNRGAVFTHVAHGSSQEGFAAEWRGVNLLTVDGDLISRCELFDEDDIDIALAKFNELDRPTPQRMNAASRLYARFRVALSARDWDALADSAIVDLSGDNVNVAWTIIATRGARLVLVRERWNTDQGPQSFSTDVLKLVEIDADERMFASAVQFDSDAIDAAFAELDARYLADEAAAYADTWSVIARNYAEFNRHEFPSTTPDWVTIDHRRTTSVEADDLPAFIGTVWEDFAHFAVYIETVHRLSEQGAIVTQVSKGTAQEGFEAEWRELNLLTIDGGLVTRSELFDESDLDAALARFEELSTLERRLVNPASHVLARHLSLFGIRDWKALAEGVAEDFSSDDRRHLVGAGTRRGRDAEITEARAMAELGVATIASAVMAIRGKRLALCRFHFSSRGQEPQVFHADALGIVEINADNQLAARVMFDTDDIDAAITELEARYVAGEAAAHARTWAVIAQGFAAANRRELVVAAPDIVNIDHRQLGMIDSGRLISFLRESFEGHTNIENYVEAVHRLTDVGAVLTHVAAATSNDGFDAEWRNVIVEVVDDDNLISRVEIFDEADLDAALASLDEFSRPTSRLENAATQTYQRILDCFAARDWNASRAMISEHVVIDDRRRTVNAGVRNGLDAAIEDGRAFAVAGFASMTASIVATRGTRLALLLVRGSAAAIEQSDTFHGEALAVIEVDGDERMTADVVFNANDIDAALTELDARYLKGEGADHARTWSVIAHAYAAANRGELAATSAEVVNIDHRHLGMIAPGKLIPYLRSTFNELTNLGTYVESLHRLTDRGALVTHVGTATSKDGFDAEWRVINLLIVEGGLCTRSETFDEADLDAALARFDELDRPKARLENAASQVDERFRACFAARDWGAMAETMAADVYTDDRRPVVGIGVRKGRDAAIAHSGAVAEIGVKNMSSTVVATRGDRLILRRARFVGRDQGPEAFHTETLSIVETNADNQILAAVQFELDDMEAAIAELDARYLAGEAAAHPHTWSVVARTYAGLNRNEGLSTTPNSVTVDHRAESQVPAGDMTAVIGATPELNVYIESVHRLTDLGVVVTQVAQGTSQDRFDAEWRFVCLLTVEDDLISSGELFDESDLDVAVARFDEISRSAHHR